MHVWYRSRFRRKTGVLRTLPLFFPQTSKPEWAVYSEQRNFCLAHHFIVSRDIRSHFLKNHTRVGKTSGPDNISGKEIELLGEASSMIAKFPNRWKIAPVYFIHKKGNTLDCGNHHPISLLSIQTILPERVVCFLRDSFFNSATDSQ